MSYARVINHHGYDDPGTLRVALQAEGYAWDMLFREEITGLEDLGGTDLLISLGSRWSPLAITAHPAIRLEIKLFERAIGAGLPVLGVCFGAQLLTVALGGNVRRLERPLEGWHQFEFAGQGAPAEALTGFFWNAYGFDAPEQTVSLGQIDGTCAAFSAPRLLAYQFHADVTPTLMLRWMREGLTRSRFAALEADWLTQRGENFRELQRHASRAVNSLRR